ncbi:hypothetical protein EZMO1_0078 [Endozoicomonas montiporae CL-33]|uniref:Uncharacterized protein n=1 Tax=Endozoicomonas montiporae CL-33 TaxID=570277 RepID=A0A142B6H5_9GAMM|nr:hypothetical protein EZMO1_0078 [Endozoicomonas montiporae CL-33]
MNWYKESTKEEKLYSEIKHLSSIEIKKTSYQRGLVAGDDSLLLGNVRLPVYANTKHTRSAESFPPA